MIDLTEINSEKPYKKFIKHYKNALLNNQKSIEAITISSFNKTSDEVESRFVNLKYVVNDDWIFFSNYKSNKAINFISHNQISALLYWNTINVQIRIKATIRKSPSEFSDKHFMNRSSEKNALAISSAQSMPIASYDSVISNYNKALNNKDSLSKRPDYWGGYYFTAYLFEFWEGNESRMNKRKIYTLKNSEWVSSTLQP